MKIDVVTYEPDNSLRKGYFQIFNEIFTEIMANRWLTYQLFRRNLISMYKQSFVGLLWMIILPVINMGVFALLHNSGIFNIGEIGMPYPIYAISGLAFWQIFAVGVGSCNSSLVMASDMITRINFSKKSLLFAPMGRTLLSFLIQLCLVGVLFIVYKKVPSLGILALPVVVLPILLLTLGIGFLVSIMNAIVRDIGNIIGFGLTFLMYLTPILYARPQIGILSHVTQYSPMYYFVSTGRSLILNGEFGDIRGFCLSALFAAIFFCVSLVIFHLTETRIAERI